MALALSAVALGAAVIALMRETPEPRRTAPRVDRVARLEARIDELEAELASRQRAPAQPARHGMRGVPGTPPPAEPDAAGVPAELAAAEASLESIVDDAVDKKTKQVLDEIRIKANKKPPMTDLASVLGLTEEQREATERVIVDGQRDLHRILGIPAADGTNLMDELVEIVAKGIAQPGKDHGFGRWFARVVSENIPGTNTTYGARIEALKQSMRERFRRDWTTEQYKAFEEWGVDPTEIQDVPGSPNEQLEKRILDRARMLGADIPEGN